MAVLSCKRDNADVMPQAILTIPSTRPVYIFFGAMVQIFGAIGEWILGNTFSCALFFTYGMCNWSWTMNASMPLLIRTPVHRYILARPRNIAHAVLCRWNNVLT
jgi:succinate-acetate transporter protein